jgi:hypothetical protein
MGSLPGGMEALHAGKKGRTFILGGFYTILNLEVRRKARVSPVSSGLQARGGSGRLTHTPMLILRYPKSTVSRLTKTCNWNGALWVQRKWIRERWLRFFKLSYMVFKSPKFSLMSSLPQKKIKRITVQGQPRQKVNETPLPHHSQ